MPKALEIASPIILLNDEEYIKAITGRMTLIDPQFAQFVGKICKLTNKSTSMFSHRYFYCSLADYGYFTKQNEYQRPNN